MKTLLSLLFFAIFFWACTTNDDAGLPVVGVKIYDYHGNIDQLINTWQGHGINTVFASPELLGKDGFVDKLKLSGLKSFMIFPVFFDSKMLENDLDLYAITGKGEKARDDWVHFACPTREKYRQLKIQQGREYVENLQPDGISIDFIRYFVFWETVYPEFTLDSLPRTCYCRHCLGKFEIDQSINIPDTLQNEADIAVWIDQYKNMEWIEWKCNQITTMIHQIGEAAREVKPDIMINVHLVPWKGGDYDGAIRKVAGQDVSQISGHTDFLSPMTYSHMVKREPEWIHSVVWDIYEQSSGKVIPSIQVSKAYLDTPLTLDEFGKCIEQALLPPSQGVVFWSWDHLAASPEKLQIQKEHFKK